MEVIGFIEMIDGGNSATIAVAILSLLLSSWRLVGHISVSSREYKAEDEFEQKSVEPYLPDHIEEDDYRRIL